MKRSSIRVHLLCCLLLPLSILGIVSTCIAYFMSVKFADDAYDRALLNSADSVAARLKDRNGKLYVDLPPAAQAVLRHNDNEKFYYQVLDKTGKRLSGDAIIPGPYPNLETDAPVFRNTQLDGEDVRIARIRVQSAIEADNVVLVQVAQTLHGRRLLATQILLSIVVPQFMLIVFGALAVWLGVRKGLLPLTRLEVALFQRSQHDLTLLSEEKEPEELRPLVQAINGLLLRLQADIESQQRFVANAAHQFRTPLAALKTYLYSARKSASESSVIEPLANIEQGINRMAHLSNKLLSLARAEPASKTSSVVDLNFIASEVTAEFVNDAFSKNLDLSFVPSRAPALVSGDQANLKEMTSNLIENAILYSPAGTAICVRVDSQNSPAIVVQDSGPGIPLEEREKVFERFYRILGTDVPGSGLGLAIVKEIANSHRAGVTIATGPGGIGIAFTVSFPGLEK